MANPKYAGLPGIASPDEKDIYETDDLPEADQDVDYVEEAESENIERPHLRINEAHNRFKDKILIGGRDLDFSDRLRRRRNIGYEAVSGEYEIAAQGEKETVLQKYNRIQCEIKELLEEISEIKQTTGDAKNEEVIIGNSLLPQLEQSLQQLNDIKLQTTLGVDVINNIVDPQGTQISKLLSQVESLKKDTSTKTSKKSGAQKTSTNVGLLTFQLQNLPEHVKLQNTVRISDLEERLKKLENVIGSNSDKFNHLKSTEYRNIVEAVDDLSAKASLLNPAIVDRVENKLTAVATRMDAIAEKRGEEDSVGRETKINELYQLLQNTEALSRSLPSVLDRLIALKNLHAEAGQFQKSLTEFDSKNKLISLEIEKNESLLMTLQDTMKKHMEVMAATTKNLDERIKSMKK